MEGIAIVTHTSAEKVIIKKEVNDTSSVDRRSHEPLRDNKSAGSSFAIGNPVLFSSLVLDKLLRIHMTASILNSYCNKFCLLLICPS
jgi:hypothetical protein